jgi:hypothetical protein
MMVGLTRNVDPSFRLYSLHNSLDLTTATISSGPGFTPGNPGIESVAEGDGVAGAPLRRLFFATAKFRVFLLKRIGLN